MGTLTADAATVTPYGPQPVRNEDTSGHWSCETVHSRVWSVQGVNLSVTETRGSGSSSVLGGGNCSEEGYKREGRRRIRGAEKKGGRKE